MSKFELKYNKKKILLLLLISILLIFMFVFIFVNANELVLKTPNNGRYSWVGHLFFHKENLLKTCSLIIILIFCLFFIHLSPLLIRQKLCFEIIDNHLLIDGKKITNISNIKAVKLNHFNKNYSLEIELKDNNQIIEKNILDKFISSIRVFLKSNPLVISRINYVKKNPNDFFLIFKKALKV
jgi:hypothetical protein